MEEKLRKLIGTESVLIIETQEELNVLLDISHKKNLFISLPYKPSDFPLGIYCRTKSYGWDYFNSIPDPLEKVYFNKMLKPINIIENLKNSRVIDQTYLKLGEGNWFLYNGILTCYEY